MRRSFRSELIRIWRPSFLLGGIGVMAGFAALVSIFIFTSAEETPVSASPALAPGPGAYTVAQIARPDGFLTALGTVSRLAGVILLALWAITMATDYSTGLIRILVQAQPKRIKLLAGKILALAVFTVLAATVTTALVVIIARPLARLQGIQIQAWKSDFLFHLLKGYFDFTVAVLVWGLIGLMLAVLTRSAALAIGIGIGFLLVVESLITIVAPGASSYLPGGSLNALAAGGNHQLSWAAALAIAILYGAIATTVSLLTFRARDVTS
jgi:ABC-type transport system involved in multi-copper enzyme maturation permease subunit